MTQLGSDPVRAHYHVTDLGAAIRAGLMRTGKSLDALTHDDLAMVDAFHLRGRVATEELAALAEVRPGCEAIDVGSGIGGAARHLAATRGCKVTGVDLSDEFCALATQLSALVGLASRTRFVAASALDLPFPAGAFDLAWTEHAQMNIADKRRLYGEIARVLRKGGAFAFHDIFRGPGGEPRYPLPWADEPSISALATPEVVRAILEEHGLEIVHWNDTSERSAAWLEEMVGRLAQGGPPPLGVHLLMGESTRTKLDDLRASFADRATVSVQAVLRKR